MKTICVLPGDGIGPEVIGCAVEVIEHVTDDIEIVEAAIGRPALKEGYQTLPDDTLALMKSSDSCLFGAVTSLEREDYVSPVLRFRRELDLYANIRPAKTLIPRKGLPPIDIVLVRENLEGLYSGREESDASGVTTYRRISRRGCGRIIGRAIQEARTRDRAKLCCVHKANVLRESDGLFVAIFRELTREHANWLSATDQLVDSAAMRLVTDPGAFEVIVTLNMYGDILSDVSAGVAGGLGFLPSGNVGDKYSVFEPAHGSAPDIAGKGIANPTATILAGAMMLRHLGLGKGAERIERAVKSCYDEGILTTDVGGSHGSRSFTDEVLKTIDAE